MHSRQTPHRKFTLAPPRPGTLGRSSPGRIESCVSGAGDLVEPRLLGRARRGAGQSKSLVPDAATSDTSWDQDLESRRRGRRPQLSAILAPHGGTGPERRRMIVFPGTVSASCRFLPGRDQKYFLPPRPSQATSTNLRASGWVSYSAFTAGWGWNRCAGPRASRRNCQLPGRGI
jgi:hypothetical protein